MLKEEKIQFFVLAVGFTPPHPPPWLHPYFSHVFGLRTLVGTGSLSTAFKELPVSLFFFCITRKIKIGKIWNLVFLPIQPIPDLPCRFDHFWIFISRVVKYTWKMQNLLNRKKKIRFFRFLFFELWSFLFWKTSIFNSFFMIYR